MEWKNEIRKLSELVPNPKNPRKITKKMVEKLKESLSEFGAACPLIVNTDGQLIGGHQRAKTLQLLGYDTVEVRIPLKKLTQRQCDKLCIMLNKVGGNFDDNLLANEWDEDLLLESGFTEEELCIDAPLETEERKQCIMTIKFDDQKHLKEAEDAIAAIVESYEGATYKIK